MATKTESTVQVPWAVTTEQRAPALQITVPQCTYVLPWSRFLYAEGDSSEIRAFFSTHDFVVQGRGLGHLFRDLAAQRVTVLKQPIRADRVRERQFPGRNHQYRSARCPGGGMSQLGR